MNKYIGTKTVKAEPMTMGEAYELKLLKEGVRPSECETDKAGYLVEYEGGYQSWSPANVFEKAYKIAETPLDIMRLEYDQISKRLKKGIEYINSPKYPNLSYLARVAFSVQNEIRHEYCNTLQNRIGLITNTPTSFHDLNFGTAIKVLKAGGAVRRLAWNKGIFIVKQVPAHITKDTIPNMQSLPQIAKDILMARQNPHIDYTDQILIIHPDGRADSWAPSTSEVFAEDWEIVK